jgi:hypothetical protein
LTRLGSLRKKGISYVREVRKILEGMGHEVEGPGYATCFFNGRTQAVHKDYFSVFDLISWNRAECKFVGHQVSTLAHKAEKVKAIQKKGLHGWVWARYKDERKVGYRIFFVKPEYVDEGEVLFLKERIERPPVRKVSRDAIDYGRAGNW